MYKLLTQDMTSHNGMRWQLGITNKATGKGKEMCTDGVLHCYNNPYLAVLLNPIHADISNPRLFRISIDKVVATDQLKYASKRQTLLEELPLPKVSTEQRIEFAIRVTMLYCKDQAWCKWADNWLSGKDRSSAAANAAARAAYDAANAAARAAYAAGAAARTAYAAADAANFNSKLLAIVEQVFGKAH